jgi:hypothetical protein
MYSGHVIGANDGRPWNQSTKPSLMSFDDLVDSGDSFRFCMIIIDRARLEIEVTIYP